MSLVLRIIIIPSGWCLNGVNQSIFKNHYHFEINQNNFSNFLLVFGSYKMKVIHIRRVKSEIAENNAYSSELDFFRPFPIIISYVNQHFRYDNLLSFFNNNSNVTVITPWYYVYQRVFLK